MTNKFQIGLFTSAWDEVAWVLVRKVCLAVQDGVIPNSEIAFVLCSREKGETEYGDLMIRNVREIGLPLITFSSMEFEPQLRAESRRAEQRGDLTLLDTWRAGHDSEIAKLIPATDLDVLLGYMWVAGPEMCRERRMINLHPALPDGPKGTFRQVIQELIASGAKVAGAMMHLVANALDAGEPITYCSFPIKSDYSSQEIREQGVLREPFLVVHTIGLLAAREIRIKNNRILDQRNHVLEGGYNLSEKIDSMLLKLP